MRENTPQSAERAQTFIVTGLCCASEVRLLEAKLGPVPGVSALRFDVVGGRLTVEGPVSTGDVQRAVLDAGMTARLVQQQAPPLTLWQRHGRLTMASASGLLLAAGLAVGWRGGDAASEIALLALAAVAGGWFSAPRAWRAARSGTLDMNVLMTLAAIGAAGIGEWSEGASVMFLFAVAQVLESFSMDRARHAIGALMELAPAEATVRRSGAELVIPVSEVAVGEVVVVRPGQKVPLDGVIQEGHSSVNQAPITGESLPVDKSPGADAFAENSTSVGR